MYSYIVIDDEALIRKNIIKKISKLNLPLAWVGEAEDGEEGLELINSKTPDIVLTDMRMPEVDGVTLLKTLTSLSLDTQIIVISGYSDFEYTKEAISANVAGYILKPFDNTELYDVLSKVITKLESNHAKQKNKLP
ncbi:response regulator [Paenibacillus yanchengensis]|uniref:Response regulator n=1 Tax=Paenibacillus yanchengensis TaxID=2035833 RepID=A0ABW4YR81_9BACL